MKQILYALGFCLASQFLSAQTGIPVPQMTQTDNYINNFLATYGIPGATVAIAKDGKIVYMRGFGYSDINKTTPTQPYNLFRIASLSKQITSIAIMKLMEMGQLTLSSKVFGPGGILQSHPVFSTANITDSRIYNITVQNLLEHSAGWNRDADCNLPNPLPPYNYTQSGCDPISFPLYVTQATGTSNPVSKDALVKFLLEKGLNFAPGTSYNYSNIGYLVLGDIIEKISGLPYETYVQNNILAPLGIYDMHLAKNLLADKQEREGEYVGNGYTTLSCYGTGQQVPWEYGGFSVEAMDAHGGWIASSRDMLKLLTAVDGFATKPDILSSATIATMVTPSANNIYYANGWSVNPSNNWWHTGSLDGTASEWVRSNTGGYSWIIILDKRNIVSSNFDAALDNLGWNCVNYTNANSTWPTWDLMASPTVNSSNLNVTDIGNQSVNISWNNGDGTNRLLLARADNNINAFPLDGTDYTANSAYGSGNVLGTDNYVVYNGTGNSTTVTGLTAGKTYYFRLVEFNKNATTGNNALYLLGSNPVSSLAISSALPVKLASFTASKTATGKALISWETTEEINSDFFDLQKSSDGVSFSSITKIAAKGNSSLKTAYSFTDNNPYTEKNYYRLRSVDKDGQSTLSKIVLLNYSATASTHFGIASYSGKTEFILLQNGDMSFEKASLVVTNIAGQTILKTRLANSSTQTIQLSGAAKGVYVVTVNNGQQVYSQKLIIR